jgi:hypothetical protein
MAGHADPPAVGPWTEFGIGGHLADNQIHVAAPVRVGLLEPGTRIAKRRFGGLEAELLRPRGAARVANAYFRPMSGTERFRQILRASLLGISMWRGTASTVPVLGLIQSE